MREQWYYLGVELKVSFGALDRIRAQSHNSRHQLQEMLKTWLTTSDNPSRKALTYALRSVGASQLAGILERKYSLVEETEVHESKQLTLAVSKDKDCWLGSVYYLIVSG